METLQYGFALGHSDISDLLVNTVGTLAGAVTARLAGQRLYPVWIGLALTAAGLFAILVLSGPRLGDVDKVVEVAAPGAAEPGGGVQASTGVSSARP